MEANIKIKFVKIKGLKLEEKFETDNLLNSTKTTLDKLCKAIQKHFKDNKIEVQISHEVKQF